MHMLLCMKPLTANERQELGQTLQRHRKKRKLSQESLAASISCHQATVSRIESGAVLRPDPIVIIDYARAVGCNPFPLLARYFESDAELEQAS